ncbi:cytochrome P450 monooxygenase pc-1 [Mycena pura]|uniref:Cytochrome P450 monooxygenase pc-1 n=1 Tax=Mycena pura TaxID=153505 RepID=A0AAD6XW11_9AGAR|nr:cytochrome P450 monooxygenase pc-1 [Mycena pura]
MELTPGIRFLTRNLVVPSIFVLLAHRAATWLGFGVSLWTVLLASVVAPIAFAVARNVAIEIHHRREAERLGARLAPRIAGKWPGNFDFVSKLLYEAEHGYLGDEICEVVASLGPVVNIWPLWENLIFTTSPEHIQIILATDFSNYVKGHKFRNAMESVLGSGVFNSDGEMWSFHRSMTRPYFTRDRVQHFEIFERNAAKVINHIKHRMREGYAVDFQDLIGRFTMDAATEFLFGSCLNSLSAALPYPNNAAAGVAVQDSPHAQEASGFTRAFSEAISHIAFRERVGWIWPLYEVFADRTARPMSVVMKYLDPVIHDALERNRLGKEAGTTEERENSTLLDELIKSTSDLKVLKDEMRALPSSPLNILLAGRDTTMGVLTIAIYFLARHPNVTARLREEILSCVGLTNAPTYDDIKRMKYLRAVINETMRLYPPVETVNATTWPSPDPGKRPIYIPAGVKVPYSVMLMQRRTDLWGPDAGEFDPDRFLDERVQKYLVSNPFQFLPFNAGPRICLGQQFAYNEMSFVLTRLLQNFSSVSLDLEAFPPDGRVPADWKGKPGRKGIEQFRPRSHLTLHTRGGLWVKMAEA